MAETDLHWDWMVTITQRLKRFYAGQKVYVAGNLLIYYEEGNPYKSVAPETIVVKNCKPGRRDTFLIWKEKRGPNFILETTSKTTRREDKSKKKTTYAQINVAEYFLYDPGGDWLKPPLQGFRLVNGEYEPILPDAEGGIVSRELGVRFVLENGDLAMYELATGKPLLSQEELAKQESQRANEAEQRVKALEEELSRLREKKVNGVRRKNGS